MQEVTLFATCVNELPRQKERVLLLRQCRNRTAITRWNSCIAWFRLVPKVAMYYYYYVLVIGMISVPSPVKFLAKIEIFCEYILFCF